MTTETTTAMGVHRRLSILLWISLHLLLSCPNSYGFSATTTSTLRPSLVVPIHPTTSSQRTSQFDNSPQLRVQQYNTEQQLRQSSLFIQRNSNSAQDDNNDISVNHETNSQMSKFIQTIRARSNTMRSAGFYSEDRKSIDC